ncbi:MAG: hypothetical protein WA418_08935 [Bradyrhizobium sp.]
MRTACAVALLAAVAGVGPSSAACSKPEAPACALETIPFVGMQDFDACRMQMLAFRDRMDAYASCRGETSSDDEKAARADYEDIRVRFNRRARGE